MLRSRAPEKAQVEQLDRELAALDSGFPSYGIATCNLAAGLGRWLLREDPYFIQVSIGEWRVPVKPGWRHAFSMRIFKADAFHWLDRTARELEACESARWSEARGKSESLKERAMLVRNEIGSGSPTASRFAFGGRRGGSTSEPGASGRGGRSELPTAGRPSAWRGRPTLRASRQPRAMIAYPCVFLSLPRE